MTWKEEAPAISEVSPSKVNTGRTVRIELKGEYFSPQAEITLKFELGGNKPIDATVTEVTNPDEKGSTATVDVLFPADATGAYTLMMGDKRHTGDTVPWYPFMVQ